MIYRVRTINLRAENTSARDAAVRAATYATAHFPGIQVEILENINNAIQFLPLRPMP